MGKRQREGDERRKSRSDMNGQQGTERAGKTRANNEGEGAHHILESQLKVPVL
jgi:hypothetical protein